VKTAEKPADPASQAEPPQKKNGALEAVREFALFGALALVLVIVVRLFLVQVFYIPSGSMEQTLHIGDRILVDKIPYYLHDPRTGDIVVFTAPCPNQQSQVHRNPVSAFLHWLGEGIGLARPSNEDFVKRVIGVPGETVQAHDGHVYVDGKQLSEPYLDQNTADFGPVTVQPGRLFVMGDNRSDSLDSRVPCSSGGLGQVPISDVVGKASLRIWPLNRFGLLH
jgi:signal peptidase I